MKTRIMIYVDDVDMSVEFWTDEFGAKVVARQTLNGGYQNVIVGISQEVELSIFPKDYIRIYSPEVSETVPSLVFVSDDFDRLHDELISAGEITEVNGALTFNFQDPEGNYFVVVMGLTLRTLENDTIVSVLSFEKTVSETKRILKKGYHHIKYKVVNNPDEIDRIIQLADIIPDDVSIRIDPNQSLNYFQTMEMINALDESTLNVEFIEQPVKSINYEDMKRISRQTKIPIIADESVFNLEDAKRIIENHYGSAINIKLIKSGGPLEVIELATFAKRHDVDCLFGCTIEANISMTMSAYLSAGLSNVKYIDLDGLDYIADSPFIGGIKDDHGQIMIPKQDNGLGISLLPNEALKYISDFINNYEV
ncbi:hypothetical protein FHL06_06105 [Lactobacillus halodurans]|uniref:VOC domain-containing protein n=1 Tax=Companilactobacillus halodurans TaxID=2584183 RepID=A0A5P0ZNZ3_9LACO|nr:enolase C-terminal domain-like protein [Companilactobacillus halodurans]MQS75957.1 hypothetical protein [Companilactobacillus halodurans]